MRESSLKTVRESTDSCEARGQDVSEPQVSPKRRGPQELRNLIAEEPGNWK